MIVTINTTCNCSLTRSNNVYAGVGPAKAIGLIRQHKNIEEILKQAKVSPCPVWEYTCANKGGVL